MTFARLYADERGWTHFEEVDVNFDGDLALAARHIDVSSSTTATEYYFLQVPKGWFADWHQSPAKSVFFFISGEWEIRASDGEIRRFFPGNVLIMEDTTGAGHFTRIVGHREGYAAVVEVPD